MEQHEARKRDSLPCLSDWEPNRQPVAAPVNGAPTVLKTYPLKAEVRFQTYSEMHKYKRQPRLKV